MLHRLPRLIALVAVLALILLPPSYSLATDPLPAMAPGSLPTSVTVEANWFSLTAAAQSCEGNCPPLSYPPLPGLKSAPYSPTGISGTLDVSAYVNEMRASVVFCKAISNRAYLVDCLSERIGAVAAKMPAYGGTAEIRATLVTASRQLGAVANKYKSRTTPAVNMAMGGPTPIATTRPLRPVAPQNLDAALSAASAIVAETETILLRSSTDPAQDALAFQQVAAVIGSTKVLLRSS